MSKGISRYGKWLGYSQNGHLAWFPEDEKLVIIESWNLVVSLFLWLTEWAKLRWLLVILYTVYFLVLAKHWPSWPQ